MVKQAVKLTFLAMMVLLTTIGKAQAFLHYITKSGDKLYDGQNVFRFMGVNAANINGHYDGYKNTAPEFGYAYDPIELSYEMES